MEGHAYDFHCQKIFGLTRGAILTIFAHNLALKHGGTIPKLGREPSGRKRKKPAGLIRSEIKYFMSLYPDARYWGAPEWEMFHHINLVGESDNLRGYADNLIFRVATSRG